MFRTIRRAPWIALGATAAYYLDGANGPARRRDAMERAQRLADRAREQMRGTMPPMSGDDSIAAPVSESVAGVSGAARMGVTSQVVEESEWRATGIGEEHRRSEDTVIPAGKGVSGGR